MLFSRNLHNGLLHALHSSRSGIIAVVAVASLIGGCSTAPPGNKPAAAADAYAGKSLEDQVRERATKRWEALIRGDLDGAYGYFSRATRDTYPLELYKVRMRPGMWREARVDAVKCEDSVCEVTVMVNIEHNRLKGIITPVAERWIVQDGVAWYVYNG